MWCHTLFPYAGSSMGPGAFNEHLQLLMPLPSESLWELNGHGEGRSITTLGHCEVPPLSYLCLQDVVVIEAWKGHKGAVETTQIAEDIL